MSEAQHNPIATSAVDRRTLFRGLAVGGVALPLLAACGGGSSGPDTSAPSGGAAKVATADVPVGGGTVLADQQVVVTQPAKGQFKAFTAVCTHQGCIVSKVEGGEIVCPCHFSHFSIQDGSPVSGPATAPLAEKKVTVTGGQLSVA